MNKYKKGGTTLTDILLKAALLGVFLIGNTVPILASQEALPVVEPSYLIGCGDELIISIWKDESLTREVSVMPDGKITFPLIGEVIAQDKTIKELKKTIEEQIKRFVPDPVLSIEIKRANSMLIYVIGRVNNPNRFILNSKVNVLQGLAMAGGLTPFAEGDNIKILRSEGGQTKIIYFKYSEVIKGKNLEQNIILQRGDVIVVP